MTSFDLMTAYQQNGAKLFFFGLFKTFTETYFRHNKAGQIENVKALLVIGSIFETGRRAVSG